jgi:membrane protein implicated in regulation of membrane protease activity
MIWFLIGIGLCLLEAVFPTAFVALVAGVSALIVAFLPITLPIGIEVALWLTLTALGIWASRGFVDRRAPQQFDAKEGKMLTDLIPGEFARVLYEGNSWKVVGRQGTTLLVLPESDPRR